MPTPPPLDIASYLAIRSERPKNLVIGCGASPQRVYMGAMQGTLCSLRSDHHNDFTVDLSPDAGANLTLDFTNYKNTELHTQGKGQFDTVTFEYLNRGPRDRFSEAEITRWIEGADALLKPSGTIRFYNGDRKYCLQAESAMRTRGFSVIEKIEPPSQDNPHGHMYREGTKAPSFISSMVSWIKG